MTALARALVTGGTGLLGSSIVRRLLAGEGEVVALVRDVERARRLLPEHPRLRLVAGDVTRAETVRAALPGVTAVLHTAAYFREYYQPGRDAALLRRTNVQAVADLLDEAERAGTPVVVHTSSIGVLGGSTSDGVVDESSTPPPDVARNGYRASKVAAETVVAQACARGSVRVSVVLPGWMWGPGDAGPTSAGRLFLSVARQELHVVPRAGNTIVDARDVAEACVRAADVGRAGRRYVVAGEFHRLAAVCAAVADTVGVPAPREVPARLALVAVTAMELQARARRRPPVATRDGLRVLLDNDRLRFSSERAQRELGVDFRPLARTLADEADWYADRGELPSRLPGRTS